MRQGLDYACTDNWECNKTPELKHVYWLCVPKAWLHGYLFTTNGGWSWLHKDNIILCSDSWRQWCWWEVWGDLNEERENKLLPTILFDHVCQFYDKLSLLVLLACLKCVFLKTVPIPNQCTSIHTFWIDLRISIQELSYKNCSRYRQLRGALWGECALLLSRNQCSHCHRPSTHLL